MREIKFRVWDDKKKVWFRGYSETKEGLSLIRDFAFKGIFSELQGIYKISDLVIEQFTERHDKNGKEIYEGDIRRGGYVVKYLPDKASFMWVLQITKDTVFIRSICSEDEIIGNIHDNPELLK